MAVVPGSASMHILNDPQVVPAVVHRNNIHALGRRPNSRGGRCRSVDRSGQEVTNAERKFFGERLRHRERSHQWRSAGPGQYPKLSVVGPAMSFSQVPEKNLGLYDPSLDKDSCGVGFVAELSGVDSRKTVIIALPLVCFSADLSTS